MTTDMNHCIFLSISICTLFSNHEAVKTKKNWLYFTAPKVTKQSTVIKENPLIPVNRLNVKFLLYFDTFTIVKNL